MARVWTYPWNLYKEGTDESLADIAERGIDTISVATQYHSVRSVQPRTPEDLFDSFAGGCYFDPDTAYFDGTPIRPVENEVGGTDDPLAGIITSAEGVGLDVTAWTVCLHNTRLGAENSEYRIEDAFGNPHDIALCPSNPEVRNYFKGIVRSIVDYGVSGVELESVGYPDVCHNHGMSWGHEKRQALVSDAHRRLLSQCFCDECRNRAGDRGIEFDTIQETVKSIVGDALAGPIVDPPTLADLSNEYADVHRLLEFRRETVASFVRGLVEAAGEKTVSTYVPGPSQLLGTGVEMSDLDRYFDRVTAICYFSEQSRVRERLRAVQEQLDLPVDVGLSIDPTLIESESDLRALVGAAREETDGEIAIYHHGLATETQLDWIKTTFEGH